MHHQVARLASRARRCSWLIVVTVAQLASACSDVRATVVARARSPDGHWLATVYEKQWGGPGTAAVATTVELQQGTEAGQEILIFSHDSESMRINLTWLDLKHLVVSYGPAEGDIVRLDFQAVKMDEVAIDAKLMP